MMLKDADCVKHLIFLSKVLSQLRIGGSLIDGFKSGELRERMVLSANVTDVDFVGWSGCEVAGPVSVSIIAIWEPIICFHGKFNILFLNSVDVLARS